MTAQTLTPADVAEAARLYPDDSPRIVSYYQRAAYLAGLTEGLKRQSWLSPSEREEVLRTFDEVMPYVQAFPGQAARVAEQCAFDLAARLRGANMPGKTPAPDDGMFFFGEVALPMNSPAPRPPLPWDALRPGETEAGRIARVLGDQLETVTLPAAHPEPAPADTVLVSREWLESAASRTHYCDKGLCSDVAAEIDRLLGRK